MPPAQDNDTYRPMPPGAKKALWAVGALLIVLIGAAVARSVLRRLELPKSQPEHQARTPAEPSAKPVSPAVAVFKAAEGYLAEFPDQLEQAQENFEKVAREHPGSEWGIRARSRARELYGQRIDRAFGAWTSLTETGTGAEVLDGYLQFIDAWTPDPVVDKAEEQLRNWFETHTAFSLQAVPDIINSAVSLKLVCEGKVPSEKLKIFWRINGKRAGTGISIIQRFSDPGPHPVRASVTVLDEEIYTKEIEVTLIPEAFTFWHTWIMGLINTGPGKGQPHFRITRADGEEFLAVKTDDGYFAHLRFGTVTIPANEVKDAIPAPSPEDDLLKTLSAVKDYGKDIDYLSRKTRDTQLRPEIIKAVAWWALYLDPDSRSIQFDLGLIENCTRCRGMGEMRSLDVRKCTRCKALSRKKCKSCKGEGRFPCTHGGCRRGYITRTRYRENGLSTQVTEKCPICKGKAWTLCNHCKGVQRNMCDQCRTKGPLVVIKPCPKCGGKEPDLIPFTEIPFPFFSKK